MFKYLILIMVIGQLGQAQRSWYAGRGPASYPGVLAKYKTTTTAAPTESLVNRINENGVSPTPQGSSWSPVYEVTNNDRFIKMVSSWPVDKQPFWYKNREAIWAQINQAVDGGNAQQSSARKFNNPRSPFARRN